MSTDAHDDMEMGARPTPEHAWLKRLVGNWSSVSEMYSPDGTFTSVTGEERVWEFGGLWVLGGGVTDLGGKYTNLYKFGLGYDISFNEYRGFWLSILSSHLWNHTGILSNDKNTMTLDCVGPDLGIRGAESNYREVLSIQDENHRTQESYIQAPNGEFQRVVIVRFTRE